MRSINAKLEPQANNRVSSLNTRIFLIILGVVVGAAAPFLHMLFPGSSFEETQLQEKYDSQSTLVLNYEEELNTRLQEFNEGDVVTENDIALFERYTNQKQLTEETLVSLDNAASESTFFGFLNIQYFLYAIGIPISLFICSLLLTHFASYIRDEKESGLSKLKLSMRVASIAFLFISVYYIAWTVWPASDFSPVAYYLSIIGVSAIITYAAMHYAGGVQKSILKLSKIVSNLPTMRKDADMVTNIANIMPEKDDVVVFKAMLDTYGNDLNRKLQDVERALNDQ